MKSRTKKLNIKRRLRITRYGGYVPNSMRNNYSNKLNGPLNTTTFSTQLKQESTKLDANEEANKIKQQGELINSQKIWFRQQRGEILEKNEREREERRRLYHEMEAKEKALNLYHKNLRRIEQLEKTAREGMNLRKRKPKKSNITNHEQNGLSPAKINNNRKNNSLQSSTVNI